VGNIKIEDVLPIHGNHCQLCMKCIAYCPHAAIQVLGKDHLRIRHA
jgi:NAD-dependent dihydropyrimidine dehydrogenase PreA subunit